MIAECTPESKGPKTVDSLATVGNGKALANLYSELCSKNENGIAADQLAIAIVDGLDVAKLICDGTLTNDSRGFWQLSSGWPKVVTRLPSGMYRLVIDATARLDELGGRDLAAHMPLEALVIYGNGHFEEVEDAINYALSKAETIGCVVGLLKVGLEFDGEKYFVVATNLLQNRTLDEKAEGAIYCGLRFLQLEKLPDAQKNQFVDVIKRGIKSDSKDILYATAGTLIHQYAKSQQEDFWPLIEELLKSDNNVARCSILEQLFSLACMDSLDEVVWKVLDVLSLTGFDERMIRAIDCVLAKVWAKAPERALLYVEKIVQNTDSQVECGSFPETMQKLREMTGMFINRAVTRWFLSNEPRLFRFAQALMEKRGPDEDFQIEVNTEAIHDLSEAWFLGRKGIGWFYHHKKTCVGFVLSCMAIMDKSILDDFLPTFYNPLCLHYVNEVEEGLQSRKSDSKKLYHKKATQVVKQAKALYAKAAQILPIHDLEPTTRSRGEFARYQARIMSAAFKKAKEESPLLKFLTGEPTILMHGKEWVSWRKDMSGTLRRNSTKLSRNSIRIEIPSLLHLDSLNLEYLLLRLRLERIFRESDS